MGFQLRTNLNSSLSLSHYFPGFYFTIHPKRWFLLTPWGISCHYLAIRPRGQMPAGGDGQRKPNFEPMKINTQMAKEVVSPFRIVSLVRLVPKKIWGGGESKIRWGWLEYTFAGICFKEFRMVFSWFGFCVRFQKREGNGGYEQNSCLTRQAGQLGF